MDSGSAQQRTVPPFLSFKRTILALGLNQVLNGAALKDLDVIQSTSLDQNHLPLDREDISVLLLGPQLTAPEAHRILAQRIRKFPDSTTANIIIGIGDEGELFQEFVDNDRLFYLSRGTLDANELEVLIIAAINNRTKQNLQGLNNNYFDMSEPILDFCSRLLILTELKDISAAVVNSIETVIGAEDAQCLIYDPDKSNLSSIRYTGEEQIESAAAGIVSYVARTGRRVLLDRADNDPRYDAEADNPKGVKRPHLMAEPVNGPYGDVLAVFCAVRDGVKEGFSERDANLLKSLAANASLTIATLLLRERVQQSLVERVPFLSGQEKVYRQEAMDHYAQGRDAEGDLLHSAPAWLKRSHWMIIVLLFFGLIFLAFAKVNQETSGPAIVRARHKMTVSPSHEGIVQFVDVTEGQQVNAGDTLIHMQGASGTTDGNVAELRAPGAGIVSTVWVQPGDRVTPAQQAITIIDDNSGYEIIAFLPGPYAPQVRSGTPIVLKMTGFPDSREIVIIERTGNEVISPREAATYSRRDYAEGPLVGGPVVPVRSLLKTSTFSSEGRAFSYRDGMLGKVEVTLRSEPMIYSLVPGLKSLLKK